MTNNVAAEVPISYDESATLISEMEVEKRVDLGHSHVYKGKHPQYGLMIVVNSFCGDGVMFCI